MTPLDKRDIVNFKLKIRGFQIELIDIDVSHGKRGLCWWALGRIGEIGGCEPLRALATGWKSAYASVS